MSSYVVPGANALCCWPVTLKCWHALKLLCDLRWPANFNVLYFWHAKVLVRRYSDMVSLSRRRVDTLTPCQAVTLTYCHAGTGQSNMLTQLSRSEMRKRSPGFCLLRCCHACTYVCTCATLTYWRVNMLGWRIGKAHIIESSSVLTNIHTPLVDDLANKRHKFIDTCHMLPRCWGI